MALEAGAVIAEHLAAARGIAPVSAQAIDGVRVGRGKRLGGGPGFGGG